MISFKKRISIRSLNFVNFYHSSSTTCMKSMNVAVLTTLLTQQSVAVNPYLQFQDGNRLDYLPFWDHYDAIEVIIKKKFQNSQKSTGGSSNSHTPADEDTRILDEDRFKEEDALEDDYDEVGDDIRE